MKKAIAIFIYFIVLIALVAFITIIIFFSGGCTENIRVTHFGGKGTITLNENRKLVNVTWKLNNLWILTKPMRHDDIAETYKFSEESNFGLAEGTYTIIEVK